MGLKKVMEKCDNLLRGYFEAYEKHKQEYNTDFILFYQVGSFYEVYGYKDEKTGVEYGSAFETHKHLLHAIRPYSQGKHRPENFYQVGFPIYTKDENISVLFEKGVNTVIVYNEEKQERKTVRVLYETVSRTFFCDNQNARNSFVATLYIKEWKDIRKIVNGKNTSIYLSLIDFCTGDIILATNIDTDGEKSIEETRKTLDLYNPNEYIIIKKTWTDNEKQQFIESIKHTPNQSSQSIFHFETEEQIYFKQEYINKTFEKSFDKNQEELCLDKHIELTYCLVHTIQYVYKKDISIIKRLKPPIFIQDTTYMKLNKDTIRHMGIETNLFPIVNKTVTKMGHRLLLHRLLNPVFDKEILEKRYSQNEIIHPFVENLREYMKPTIDMEKKYKKWIIGKLSYPDFNCMIKTWKQYQKIFELVYDLFPDKKYMFDAFFEFMTCLRNKIHTCKVNTYYEDNETPKNFIKNVPEITNEYNKLDTLLSQLTNIASEFSRVSNSDVSWRYTKQEYIISIKPTKYKNIPKGTSIQILDTTVTKEQLSRKDNKNEIQISCAIITKLSNSIKQQSWQCQDTLLKHFQSLLETIDTDFHKTIQETIQYIAELDVSQSNNTIMNTYGYNHPVIMDKSYSFIHAEDVRHPVVERLSRTEFIPYNISLGENDQYGCLLFGLNASGKSIYMKTVGVCIIMAQAGMPVSAKSFTYCPFQYITSRIPQSDDMLIGKSTYQVELDQIKKMTHSVNEFSLVLSDEMGSSTEHLSSHSLVSAVILFLVKRKTTFLFSTHIQSLLSITEISNSPHIQIKCMEAIISGNSIIFTRKLTNERISEVYGLEIASAYGISQEIMDYAYIARDKLVGYSHELVQKKTSRYNSEKIIDCCERCGTRKNLQTHHKREQKDADSFGIIENRIHKNMIHNLEILCYECHEKHHHEHSQN